VRSNRRGRSPESDDPICPNDRREIRESIAGNRRVGIDPEHWGRKDRLPS
jgi:hypothetical protein